MELHETEATGGNVERQLSTEREFQQVPQLKASPGKGPVPRAALQAQQPKPEGNP